MKWICTALDSLNPRSSDLTYHTPVRTLQNTSDFRAEVNMERANEGLDAIAMEEAIRYLKASKFNSGKALEIYRNYSKHMENYQITTMRPSKEPLLTEIASRKLTILDGIDQDGSPILLLKAPHSDTKMSDSCTTYQAVFFQLDKLTKQSGAQEHGYILLVDAGGFSGNHSTYINNVLAIMENGYPLFLKQVYVLNAKASLSAALASTKLKHVSPAELLQLFSDDQLQSLSASLNLPPSVLKTASQAQDKPKHTFTRVPSTPDLHSADGGVGALVGMFDGRSNSSPSHGKPSRFPPPPKTIAAGSKILPVGSKAKPTPPLKPTVAHRDDASIPPGSGKSAVRGNNAREGVASQLRQSCVKNSTVSTGGGYTANPLHRKSTVSTAQSPSSDGTDPTANSTCTGPSVSNTSSGGNLAVPAAKQKVPLKPPTQRRESESSEERAKAHGAGSRDSPDPSEGRRASGVASKVQQRAASPDTESSRQAATDRSKQQPLLVPSTSARKANLVVNGGNAKAVLVASSDVIPKPKLTAARPQSIHKHGSFEAGGEQTPVQTQGSGYEPPFMKLAAISPERSTYVNIALKPSHGYVNVAVGAKGPVCGQPPYSAQGAKDDDDEESVWSGDENIADVVYENCGPDENDRLMTVDELECHILTKGSEGLGTEYLKLRNDRLSGSYKICREPLNMPKNRYKDVMCYDDNRVVLEGSESDYIHANYVTGYNKPRAFILTQGPLKKTVVDFWKMVWANKVLVIVMVTKFVEAAKVKCAEYWSDERPEQHGDVVIQVTKIDRYDDFEQRTMIIQFKGEERTLVHFQFLAWPDYGVPSSGSSVLHLLRAVRDTQAKLAKTVAGMPSYGPPVLVHCSAGVGRSGAFCAIDYCADEFRDLGKVNVQGAVRKLRGQRAYAIQTEEQYVFCHRAVLEYAKSIRSTRD